MSTPAERLPDRRWLDGAAAAQAAIVGALELSPPPKPARGADSMAHVAWAARCDAHNRAIEIAKEALGADA